MLAHCRYVFLALIHQVVFLSDGGDMTRELVEIRGQIVTDVQFGWEFIAMLTAGKVLCNGRVSKFDLVISCLPQALTNTIRITCLTHIKSIPENHIYVYTYVCSISLDTDGRIWTSGVNNYRQLAHHGTINRPIFSTVENLPRVTQIGVWGFSCVMLTRDKKVINWSCVCVLTVCRSTIVHTVWYTKYHSYPF